MSQSFVFCLDEVLTFNSTASDPTLALAKPTIVALLALIFPCPAGLSPLSDPPTVSIPQTTCNIDTALSSFVGLHP